MPIFHLSCYFPALETYRRHSLFHFRNFFLLISAISSLISLVFWYFSPPFDEQLRCRTFSGFNSPERAVYFPLWFSCKGLFIPLLTFLFGERKRRHSTKLTMAKCFAWTGELKRESCTSRYEDCFCSSQSYHDQPLCIPVEWHPCLVCFCSLLLNCEFIPDDSGVAAGQSLADTLSSLQKPWAGKEFCLRVHLLELEFSFPLHDQILCYEQEMK